MTSGPRAQTAEDLLALAESLYAQGRYGEAADRFAEAAWADPTRPDGFVGAARAQAERGTIDEGTFAMLTQAATLDPTFLPTYGVAARIGLHYREYVFAALRLVEMGVLARGDSVDVWVWLVRLQATTSRTAGVRSSLRQLEVMKGLPRHELIRDLADDPDLLPAAVAVLRRAANLEP